MPSDRPSARTRLVVLVSGSGTNLQALLDDPGIRSHIALVLSDRPGIGAQVLEQLRRHHVQPRSAPLGAGRRDGALVAGEGRGGKRGAVGAY